MAEAKQLKEALAAYGAVAADLKAPVVLERDGQPVAVVLSFEEYRRLQDIAERKRGEAETRWKERFDRLLAEVHGQTAQYSSDEIEAEITAAFNEVQGIRYGHRGAD
jgi:PHD/YefM family antitoxin component YafN of YafNO toxin-antitoxin module